MAKDVDLARALVTELAELQPFSRNASIVYSHDDLVDASEVETEIRVEPESISHQRQGRDVWSSDVVIRFTIEGRQQINDTTTNPDTQADIDSWLDFVDEVTEHIKSAKPSGKKAVAIENEERFDQDLVKSNNVFLTTFTVSYSLV